MTYHQPVHRLNKVLIFSLIVAFMFSMFPANIVAAAATPIVSNEIIEFSQLNNISHNWVNGILNKTQTEYYEGMSSPQRVVLDGLASDLEDGTEYTKVLALQYQFTDKGNYAYDFLTSWDQAIEFAGRIGNQSWSDGWKWNGLNESEFPTKISESIPDSTSPANSALSSKIAAYESISDYNRKIDVFGDGTIHDVSISNPVLSGDIDGTSHYTIMIEWTGNSDKVMILFGAHIAAGYDLNPEEGIAWGPDDAGASAIDGAPYHVTLLSGGSQDNQIMIRELDVNEPYPSISINKVTNGSDGSEIAVGSPITWTYTVKNEGNISLGDVVVSDDQLGPVSYQSGDTDNDGRLDIHETWIYTAAGIATEGLYVNVGTVSGKTSEIYGSMEVSDSDNSSYIGTLPEPPPPTPTPTPTPSPSISINKVTNGSDGPSIEVGESVKWTYTVSNSGDVPLFNIQVTDNKGVIPVYVSGDLGADSMLGLSETWIFEATGTAIEGLYENTGTATGTSLQQVEVSDSDDSSYVGTVTPPPPPPPTPTPTPTPSPSISIDKVTNGSDGPSIEAGESVTWTYTVSNTGDTPLFNIQVTDNKGVIPVYVSGDAANVGVLDIGETWIFEATGTAVDGDYENTGTASGISLEQVEVSDSDDSNYTGYVIIPDAPSILISKVTNGSDGLDIDVGDDVTWTYTVTNTGNVPLYDIEVTDNKGVIPVYISGDAGDVGVLDIGETWIFEATGTAIEGDYVNTGTATGMSSEEVEVSDSDDSNYTGVELIVESTTTTTKKKSTPTLVVESGTIPTLEVHDAVIPETGDKMDPIKPVGLILLLISGAYLISQIKRNKATEES